MLETLRCPSCSTRYGLRPSRVRAGIRRAQCFRCDTVFGIEEAVAHLLAFAPLPEAPAELPPSLTLGDLEGAEEEIMDKTMIDVPAPLGHGGPDGDDSPYLAHGPGYASAKDAISKLMGSPLAPKAPVRPQSSHPGGMDVEATLNALEDTLGGQKTLEARTAHAAEPKAETAPVPEPKAEAAPAPEPPRALGTGMASTMRLSSSEIQAALAAALPPGLPPVVATVPVGSTVPMAATVPVAAARTEPVPRPDLFLPAPGAAPAQDPNLLKIQLEQEVYNNVTLEQMSHWIEEGRVHEYNMVARQFSEHWIEASKVPALRPIFEQRKRRLGLVQDDMPIPPSEILPQKRGLFGGLFGRS